LTPLVVVVPPCITGYSCSWSQPVVGSAEEGPANEGVHWAVVLAVTRGLPLYRASDTQNS
jgi:hypothetical protein